MVIRASLEILKHVQVIKFELLQSERYLRVSHFKNSTKSTSLLVLFGWGEVSVEKLVQQENDHRVRSDSHEKCRIACPEAGDSFSLEGLREGIHDTRVGHLTGTVGSHLLKLGLDIVERKTAE